MIENQKQDLPDKVNEQILLLFLKINEIIDELNTKHLAYDLLLKQILDRLESLGFPAIPKDKTND